jgi:hypothetical protein
LLELERVNDVRLLKIACEGAEQRVIPAASKTLGTHRVGYLSLEYHSTIIGETAVSRSTGS